MTLDILRTALLHNLGYLTTHAWLLVFLAALQLLDVLSTIRALKLPGLAEANPIARALMDRLGIVLGLLVLKVPALFAIVYNYLHLTELHWPLYTLALLNAIYVWIVASNVRFILAHRGRPA